MRTVDRISDAITAWLGSVWAVLFHIVWFSFWVTTGLLGNDPFPYNFLTLVVSLEAIFLGIFVLISQNRQAEKDRKTINTDLALDQAALELMQRLVAQLPDQPRNPEN